jgi:hypothetical protein
VGRLGGPPGPPWRGLCPVCALKQDVFGLGFLQVLSGVSPVVEGDPQGCPRHPRSGPPSSRSWERASCSQGHHPLAVEEGTRSGVNNGEEPTMVGKG